MEEKTKISIITVVYNGKDTIEQTINSVINQTYANIEYIIIDGVSTDGTLDILRKYADNIDVFICEPDNGLYDAMNKGIMHASGDIIGIINSDDFYTDTAVCKVAEYYDSYDVDVVYGDTVIFDETGYREVKKPRNIDDFWFRVPFMHPSTFIKKDTYFKYGMYDTQYSIVADYDLLLRFYSEGVRFGYVNEVLANFRRGGVSSRKFIENYQDYAEISTKYIDRCCHKEKYLPKIEKALLIRKFKAMEINNSNLMIDALYEIISENENKDIVIFGAGVSAGWCIRVLTRFNIQVCYIIDNDVSKWGNKLEGVTIKAPSELENCLANILITAYMSENVIRKQLESIDRNLRVFSILEWAEKCSKIADFKED